MKKAVLILKNRKQKIIIKKLILAIDKN